MLTTAVATTPAQCKPELLGQTVVVIGGSAGIGLETARRARAEGADVIVTGRDPERLERAALEIDARSTTAFDANDQAALKRFFDGLPGPIDHVLVTAEGPHDGPLLETEAAQVRHTVSEALALDVTRNAVDKMRPGGTLLLVGATGDRRIRRDLGIAATAINPPFTAALAVALAPVRVRVKLFAPIGRLAGPDDVAARAVDVMANTTLNGATHDSDGDEPLLARRSTASLPPL